MTTTDDDMPSLHPVRAERIPYHSWCLAGIETLPPGWVNVRIWSYSNSLNRDLYVTDECPGVLHMESAVTEIVIQDADPDGELFSEWGDPYDEHPVVIDSVVVDPPHRHREFADPQWRPAYAGGGYLGTCPVDMVAELLAEHGFAEAIPRPPDYVDDSDDAGEPA